MPGEYKAFGGITETRLFFSSPKSIVYVSTKPAFPFLDILSTTLLIKGTFF